MTITTEPSIESVKREAKRITRSTSITHSQALDVLAVQAGFSHWGAYQSHLERISTPPKIPFREVGTTRLGMALASLGHPDPVAAGARHLLVSGQTSSGKTTMLMRVKSAYGNKAPIASAHGFDPTSPDPESVMIGEVSFYDAATLLTAMRTPDGPCVMATVHAADPEQALSQFNARTREGWDLRREDRVVCIQMARDAHGRRHVSQVVHLG